MKSNQQGFTLIELVVVMVILGVLAATALPKFMNVNTQAHQAAVAGTGGAFGSAIAMTHAQWTANGSTGADADVDGFGDGLVDVNATGWPVSRAADASTLTTTASQCDEVWSGIMQNPPSVGVGNDYTTAAVAGVCTYTYTLDTSVTRTIAYDTSDGGVVVTNP